MKLIKDVDLREIQEYKLGIEEVAMLLVLAGKTDEGKSLLHNSIGKMSEVEEKSCLTTASHSLFSRGLITIEQNKLDIQPGIFSILKVFLESSCIIRANNSLQDGEDLITFMPDGESSWLEHHVSSGVIHIFNFPLNQQAVILRLLDFYSPALSLLNMSTLTIEIPTSLISKQSTESSTLSIDEVIKQTTGTDSAKKIFGEDFIKNIWRGSTIWLAKGGPDELLSRGTFWLHGTNRLWMINSKPDSEHLLQAKTIGINDFRNHIKEIIDARIPLSNH